MPILDDIMEHDVLGPTFREGMQKGLEQGVQKGLEQGEQTLLRRMLTKRFGELPTWVEERVSKLSTTEIEALSGRLFDAKNIDEIFTR